MTQDGNIRVRKPGRKPDQKPDQKPETPASFVLAAVLAVGLIVGLATGPGQAAGLAATLGADVTADVAADVAAECPADTPTRIWVRVVGVKSAAGTVTASLYDGNPKNFLKKGRRIAKEREPASTEPVLICMPAPGPGRYAVALYHDENANRKLDRNWIGMPKEGYGFSNNARGRLGPPSHAATAFTVDGDQTTIEITVRY